MIGTTVGSEADNGIVDLTKPKIGDAVGEGRVPDDILSSDHLGVD